MARYTFAFDTRPKETDMRSPLTRRQILQSLAPLTAATSAPAQSGKRPRLACIVTY
ncbi:MAG: hypothetical protein JNK87_21880 [Bryobacterales bacterium]|nr:hypothetical protein [Bryobacterales bacterium]